jgi:AraC-like DNA-binding protein/FixJ family two-component response regulator
MTAWKILVADDEVWVRENLCALLREQEGRFCILEPAVDGENALTRLEVDRPDILITDIDMPFLTGNELIRAGRALLPTLQVIVVSGYAEFGYVRQALLDGAVDYLLKPATRDALGAVVERAVANLDQQRTQEREAEVRTGALRRASTLLRDGALSDLLADDRVHSPLPADLGELDLTFTVYSLVLVKVLGAIADRDQLATLVAREATGSGKCLVFPNLRSRGEFLILTDREAEALDALGARLVTQLERHTGCGIEVSVSAPFYSFSKLRAAYREARTALLSRRADDPSHVVQFERVRGQAVRSRITPDLERLLAYAVSAQDKALIREVAFEGLGLRTRAAEWLLLEVKQTAEYFVHYLVNHGPLRPTSRARLTLESLSEALSAALEGRNVPQVCSLVDLWVDEVFSELSPAGSPMRQTVLAVQDYISEHYAENLSLTTLSQVFRVEASYLSKAFKQLTGANLMAAIAQRRIDKASEMIRDRELSLTDVAALVGYEEYAYFNRVFHRVAGVSPSDYRAHHGKVAYEIS